MDHVVLTVQPPLVYLATQLQPKQKDGNKVNVQCPQAIVDYNKHMGGVDLDDQYRKYYQVRMKTRKYYKNIFWFLFEICILNSFILYRYSACTSKNLTYIFRLPCRVSKATDWKLQ